MKRRRFLCSPTDLARFERIFTEVAERIWAGKRIPTSLEQASKYADSYVSRLDDAQILMDEDTLEAYRIFLDHHTFFNLHMFIHQAIWQLLDAYDSGNEILVGSNSKERKECKKQADAWRRITRDCLVE